MLQTVKDFFAKPIPMRTFKIGDGFRQIIGSTVMTARIIKPWLSPCRYHLFNPQENSIWNKEEPYETKDNRRIPEEELYRNLGAYWYPENSNVSLRDGKSDEPKDLILKAGSRIRQSGSLDEAIIVRSVYGGVNTWLVVMLKTGAIERRITDISFLNDKLSLGLATALCILDWKVIKV